MFPGLVLAAELDPATLRLRKVAKYARTSVVAGLATCPSDWGFFLRFENASRCFFLQRVGWFCGGFPLKKTVFPGFHIIFRFAIAPQMWVFFLKFSPGSIQWTSKTLVDFMRPRGASGKKFLESMQELREKVCCYELHDYRMTIDVVG